MSTPATRSAGAGPGNHPGCASSELPQGIEGVASVQSDSGQRAGQAAEGRGTVVAAGSTADLAAQGDTAHLTLGGVVVEAGAPLGGKAPALLTFGDQTFDQRAS